MASPYKSCFLLVAQHPLIVQCKHHDFVEIMTTGDAVDFGDLTAVKLNKVDCCASSHQQEVY